MAAAAAPDSTLVGHVGQAEGSPGSSHLKSREIQAAGGREKVLPGGSAPTEAGPGALGGGQTATGQAGASPGCGGPRAVVGFKAGEAPGLSVVGWAVSCVDGCRELGGTRFPSWGHLLFPLLLAWALGQLAAWLPEPWGLLCIMGRG